jgi:hypothetical protein
MRAPSGISVPQREHRLDRQLHRLEQPDRRVEALDRRGAVAVPLGDVERRQVVRLALAEVVQERAERDAGVLVRREADARAHPLRVAGGDHRVPREIAAVALEQRHQDADHAHHVQGRRPRLRVRPGVLRAPRPGGHLVGEDRPLAAAARAGDRRGHRRLVEQVPLVDVHHRLERLDAVLVERGEGVDVALVELGDRRLDGGRAGEVAAHAGRPRRPADLLLDLDVRRVRGHVREGVALLVEEDREHVVLDRELAGEALEHLLADVRLAQLHRGDEPGLVLVRERLEQRVLVERADLEQRLLDEAAVALEVADRAGVLLPADHAVSEQPIYDLRVGSSHVPCRARVESLRKPSIPRTASLFPAPRPSQTRLPRLIARRARPRASGTGSRRRATRSPTRRRAR